MSAAEKLKALGNPMFPADVYPRKLMDALPQIVAVVEAAEAMRAAVSRDKNASWEVQAAKPPFDVAIAALDEALS